jgi:hypothetical protein
MKRLAIIVVFLSVFSSCTKDKEETTTTTDYHGKWTLVKMSGSMINSVTTGTEMDWQESYSFNNDGTFTKSRTRNTVKTTVSGTYTTQNNSKVLYLELTYPKESELIGSCYGNLKEELYFSASTTLSSTWRNCDGPGLDYEKVN